MGFIGIVGWLGVGLGVILLLSGLSRQGPVGPGLMVGGATLAFSSLFFVVIGSMASAVLDTADEAARATRLLHAIAADRGIDLTTAAALGAANGAPAPKPAMNGEAQLADARSSSQVSPGKYEYLGETIVKQGNRYVSCGVEHRTLGKAKEAIKARKNG
ncbi:hypothetical protein GE300_20940 [Rhodobacteraceae bacterium 2CG4]|uniref:Uncharacterized protein n=1 Tax=Halovulum marinum TaxID=2662447 RepID=A0A6L5Z7G0_9RHOB|nr:hypothetical protein [Halovulum marinum]MSU92024.1 hypothetical protein [Halovulum marinum]